MPVEKTRQPKLAQSTVPLAGSPMPRGFVACASCEEATEPEDLYSTARGPICALCHSDEDADDTQSRGARDLAMTVFFSPGYVAMGVAVCFPMLRFLTPHAGTLLAIVPFLCMAIGMNALRTAVSLPEANTADRARLALAGLWSMGMLGLMAAGMSGLLSLLATSL